MIALIITMVVCATLVYVARMFRPIPHADAPADGRPIRKEIPPVPDDLLLQASKWHDPWAREQALRSIQELYETTGDWNRVRYVYSQQSMLDGEN